MGRHSPHYVARQLLIQRGGWPTEDTSRTEEMPPALVARQARYCPLRAAVPLQRVRVL
jgi:hypothetical protein